MNIINNNSLMINNNKFPTLSKAWEGSLYKKVGFVFASVLTCGILPLALIIHDVAKSRNLKAVQLKNFKPLPLVQGMHFTVPNTLSEDLKKVKSLITLSIASVGSIGMIYYLNKSIGPEVTSNFLNGFMDTMQGVGNTLGASLSSLRGGVSDVVASGLNTLGTSLSSFKDGISDIAASSLNGLSSEQILAARVAATFAVLGIGLLVIPKLVTDPRNNQGNEVENNDEAEVHEANDGEIVNPVPVQPGVTYHTYNARANQEQEEEEVEGYIRVPVSSN